MLSSGRPRGRLVRVSPSAVAIRCFQKKAQHDQGFSGIRLGKRSSFRTPRRKRCGLDRRRRGGWIERRPLAFLTRSRGDQFTRVDLLRRGVGHAHSNSESAAAIVWRRRHGKGFRTCELATDPEIQSRDFVGVSRSVAGQADEIGTCRRRFRNDRNRSYCWFHDEKDRLCGGGRLQKSGTPCDEARGASLIRKGALISVMFARWRRCVARLLDLEFRINS